jgi:DNA-directed RNA polymerase subunit RPC12/RpoP
MKVRSQKFKCIECGHKFDTYVDNCFACGANFLDSEEVLKKSTQLMLVICSMSSISAVLYFVDNGSMKLFSGIFFLFAIIALSRLFKMDWDR